MPDHPAAEPLLDASPRNVRLEGAIEIKQPPAPAGENGKDIWDKVSAVSGLLSGAVVVIVGYYLTDSVNTALRREEMQLTNVTEMRDLLLDLQGDDATKWKASAFTLSAFGGAAAPPLITALTKTDEIRGEHIESALRAIGLTQPDAVCEPMTRILANHTGRVSWVMHKSAIRLLGDLRCTRAKAVLRRYQQIVGAALASGNLGEYARIVDAAEPPPHSALERLNEDLLRTLRIVEDP